MKGTIPQTELHEAGGDRLSLREMERRVSAIAKQDPRILAVYLFGSRTKGEAHAGSDVDLAVLFDEPQGLEEVVDLEIRFERVLAPDVKEVDLVDLGRANPHTR